mmetsp:Transcript_5552/g.14016  ORF Transcript_5552/g.14016 Transcript_5552/m.14016 type:complete len:278 (-) Transcript_5552:736-1569(-)
MDATFRRASPGHGRKACRGWCHGGRDDISRGGAGGGVRARGQRVSVAAGDRASRTPWQPAAAPSLSAMERWNPLLHNLLRLLLRERCGCQEPGSAAGVPNRARALGRVDDRHPRPDVRQPAAFALHGAPQPALPHGARPGGQHRHAAVLRRAAEHAAGRRADGVLSVPGSDGVAGVPAARGAAGHAAGSGRAGQRGGSGAYRAPAHAVWRACGLGQGPRSRDGRAGGRRAHGRDRHHHHPEAGQRGELHCDGDVVPPHRVLSQCPRSGSRLAKAAAI